MNTQAQAPNLTQANALSSEQVLAMDDPTEALRRIAAGECRFTIDRNTAQAALKVARQSGTGLVLAAAKRFDSLAALVAADNAARAAIPASVKIDPTYRTGMDQIRAAAGSLGWQALQDAASIGALYRRHTDAKKQQGAEPESAADTMPAPRIAAPAVTGTASAAVAGQWQALQDAMTGLPDEVAIGILADTLQVVLAAKLEAA